MRSFQSRTCVAADASDVTVVQHYPPSPPPTSRTTLPEFRHVGPSGTLPTRDAPPLPLRSNTTCVYAPVRRVRTLAPAAAAWRRERNDCGGCGPIRCRRPRCRRLQMRRLTPRCHPRREHAFRPSVHSRPLPEPAPTRRRGDGTRQPAMRLRRRGRAARRATVEGARRRAAIAAAACATTRHPVSPRHHCLQAMPLQHARYLHQHSQQELVGYRRRRPPRGRPTPA